jgi:hypothetical protein
LTRYWGRDLPSSAFTQFVNHFRLSG